MKIRSRKYRLATRAAPAETGIAEKYLWRDKRRRQARDRQAVRDGQVSGEQLRWFRDGAAKRVRLIDSPL